MNEPAPPEPVLTLVVEADRAGQRLDVFLCDRVPDMSRARARRLVEEGKVRVDGRRAKKGERLAGGERVSLAALPPPTRFAAVPDPSLSLAIVHEDAHLVVIDKPAGVPSHPLRADERGTVASALVARYPEMASIGRSPREPGIVHRLDTNTSGLLLAARDAATFDALVDALEAGRIDKRYLALVRGTLAPRVIDAPIRSHPRDVRRVEVASHDASARAARTVVVSSRPIGDAWSLVEVRAFVATRHQIRAHLAHVGHPLVGDALYGGPPHPGLARHFLHASSIALAHPRTGARLALEAALPPELERVCAVLSAGVR